MKVYIVTYGDYSDYTISRVFLSKEKAENFARYHSSGYYQYRVEEYDTDDDNYTISQGYIEVVVNFHHIKDSINVTHLLVDTCSTYFTEENNGPKISFYEESAKGIKFQLVRYYKEEDGKDKQYFLDKVLKIGYDLGGQITDLLVEGYTYGQIKEILEKEV